MFNGFCDFGTWGSFGDFGMWGWAGLILNLVLWAGLIAAVTIAVIWAIRRARVPPDTARYGNGGSAAGAILQTRLARGEITREQYKLMKQTLDRPKD